jgi:hypothetical protein
LIYTPILKNVCKVLRSLKLHVGYDKECIHVEKPSGRDLSGYFSLPGAHGGLADKGETDEEELEGVAGRFAQALPGLQHLQLGEYKDANISSRDVKWGKSGRWMEYVKQRSEGTGAAENEEQARKRGRRNRRGGQRGGRRGNWRGRSNARGRGNGRASYKQTLEY